MIQPEENQLQEPLNADEMLQEVLQQARMQHIPVSENISPRVVLNRRAKTRFGCCIRKGDGFVIELAVRLLQTTRGACMQTLAHEVLHTCYGCQNHGVRWKSYAAKMNSAYGYQISRTDKPENLGLLPQEAASPNYRYRVVCAGCGRAYLRQKYSPLVAHPSRYRCARCRGRLRVEQLET